MGLFANLRKKASEKDTVSNVCASSDVDGLITVIARTKDPEVCTSAEGRIVELTDTSDSDAVRKVLTSVNRESFTEKLMKGLDDSMLLELFRDGQQYSEKALMNIRDQDMLRSILLDTKIDGKYRISMLKSVTDRELIFRIACDDPDEHVRRTAVGMIDDPDMMDAVVENAFRKAQELSGIGVVPKGEFCKYEFTCRNELLCRTFNSSKLRFIDQISKKPLCYSEYHEYGEYGLSRSFNAGIYRTVRNGIKDFYLEYPHAVVIRTDDPVTENEILVCPKCGHLKEGAARAMPKCTCGSKLNGVRVLYTYDGDE